jgi:uncharacterized phage-associated protein
VVTFAKTYSNVMSLYSVDTINKTGNTIIYLAGRIPELSKTKLLKLLYLIEERSAIKYNTPFLGIKFEVWQAGPVAKDIFVDLSDSPVLLRAFISTNVRNGGTYIEPKREFDDSEFSNNDIEVMDYVIEKYGNKTAGQLVGITHKEGSAWHRLAKEHNLIDAFKSEKTTCSDVEIDFTHYLGKCDAGIYLENKETRESFELMKM